MTIPIERTRAVLEIHRFPKDLGTGRYCVPMDVRDMAHWLLRHYLSASDLFMVTHGYTVFAEPYGPAMPRKVRVPASAEQVMTPQHYQTLIDIVACTPVPSAFDRSEWIGQWLKQWLDMPHPAFGRRSPRTLAHRPGGYDVVRQVLMTVLDSACL